MRCGEGGPGPKGSVLTASFELEGIEFTALNGGPHFKFTEAVSFLVHCADQAEVDYYWEQADRGRRRAQPMRLAQGPLRSVLAGHADDPAGTDVRSRSGEGRPGGAGDDEDDEDRHRRDRAGLCGLKARPALNNPAFRRHPGQAAYSGADPESIVERSALRRIPGLRFAAAGMTARRMITSPCFTPA